MDVPFLVDQQPGLSHQDSTQEEEPPGPLESREERSNDLDQVGPSNTTQKGLKCSQKRTRTYSKEGGIKDSNLKKVKMSDSDLQHMEVDEDPRNTNSTESDLNKSGTYTAGGLKHSFHGDIYQLKLLILILMQRFKDCYLFRLATEMTHAEKFDDVIFVNKKEGILTYDFFQAKPKQDETMKITADDFLIKTEKKLNLQEYFISYRNIMKNPKFNGKNANFTICTNIDLRDDVEDNFEDTDDVLDVGVNNESRKPKFLKLKQDSPLCKRLTPLMKEASDLNRLAEMLVGHVSSNKPMHLTDPLLRKYHAALANKIIEIETKKIKTDFIDGSSSLSEAVKNFRKVLLDKSGLSEDDFKSQWKTKNFQINFSKVLKSLDKDPQITGKSSYPILEIVEVIVNLIQKENTTENVNVTITGSVEQNIAKLAGHVFTETEDGTKKFRQGFLAGDTLPGNLNFFRVILKIVLRRKEIELSQLGARRFNINTPMCTDGDYEEYKIDNFYFERFFPLPDDGVESREINDFLKRLIFAVNLPNELELDDIIKEKLGIDFNLLDTDLINSQFHKVMLDWTKKKGGRYLTYEDAKTLFDKIVQNIYTLLTLKHRNRLENYNITFKKLPPELSTFLVSSDKQIFNLNSSFGTTLGAIKVHQTLKQSQYEKRESHIFLLLSSLSHMLHNVIDDFRSKRIGELLVIECDTEYEKAVELFVKLYESIQSNKRKKIILITQGKDALAEQFKNKVYHQNKYEEKNDITDCFTSLASESKHKLLRETEIIFQGNKITLGKLLEIRDVNKPSTEESDDLDAIIDPDSLVQLMGDEESLEVGIKQPHLSELESIYYVASAPINDKQLLSVVRNNPSDLFVIGGMTRDELSVILTPEEQDAVRVLGEDDARREDKFIILSNKNERKYVEFKEMCSEYSKIKGETFISAHLIEKQINKITWKRSYDDSIYIPRQLRHAVIHMEALKAHICKKADKAIKKKDIFLITNIEKSEFEKQYRINISDQNDIFSRDKSNLILIIEDENEENNFKNLCNDSCLSFYNIHWLKYKGNRLVWKRSEGNIKKIREMQDTKSICPVDEGELNNIIDTERVVVIADDAGAGKSTTLSRLFKESEQCEWIIKLKLIDLQAKLKKLVTVNDLDGFIENFFSKIGIGVEGNFARKLFKRRMERRGKITLLFDGFDEVSHENQKLVIKLLKFFKKDTKAKILITTSLQVKDKLENELSVLSYTFRPFYRVDQMEFLKKFWRASFKFISGNVKSHKLLNTIKKQVNGFYKKIKDKGHDDLNTPLLIRMFAEVYQEIVHGLCFPSWPGQYNLVDEVNEFPSLDLYKKIIKRKYNIYHGIKTNNEARNNKELPMLERNLNKWHQRLAFHNLFLDNDHTKILADQRELLSPDDKNKLKAVGIIQSVDSDGDTYFIHRTFAEYFAADLLVDMICRREDDSMYRVARYFLFTQIFRDGNKVIRDFCKNIAALNEGDENKWKLIEDCDLLGDVATEGLLVFDSVEDRNIRTEGQHNASERSLTELKQNIDEEYIGKGYDFLENEGIKTAKRFKILTPLMSRQFCSILDKPIIHGHKTGFDEIYTSKIFNKFVIPIIDMMKNEKLENVNKFSFLQMLSRFTQFSVENQLKIETFYFKADQLKTTLRMIERLLKEHDYEPEVVTESLEFLFTLRYARLKCINADRMLLVVDPASEFQYELKFDDVKERKEQIVELIRWKRANPNLPKYVFIEKYYEILES